MTRRRRAPRLAISAVIATAGLAVPSFAAGGHRELRPALAAIAPTHTTVRLTRVRARGTYTVIVSLAPVKAAQSVNVSVGSQHLSNVTLSLSQPVRLEFSVAVSSGSFTVRAIGPGPKVSFAVAASLLAPQPAKPPAVTPAGSTSPTGPSAGPYNKLIFSDEFTGSAGSRPDGAKWTPDTGGGCGPGTVSTNTANPANASLDGHGDLRIADLGPTSSPPYSTAQLDTFGHFSLTYGRIEARIKTSAGAGICSAFWLVADDGEAVGWPNGGELDVMEQIGNLPAQTNGFLHGPINDPTGNDQQFNAAVDGAARFTSAFHTYGLIWQRNSITWTLDGAPFATVTPSTLPASARWVFNGHPFHIVLDEAIGGWPGPPSSSTPFPAAMLVDWVHVYQ